MKKQQLQIRVKMINKISTFLILIIFTISSLTSHAFLLNFNKNHSTITTFTSSGNQFVFQIDYKSSDIHLPKQYQQQLDFVYLSKHNKNKLPFKPHSSHKKHQNQPKLSNQVKYDFQQKQVQFTDGQVIKISGKIGLNSSNNTFLELLKSSAHTQQSKLKFNSQKQTLEVLYQGCHHHFLKFPIEGTIKFEGRQKTIQIRQFASQLLMDKNWTQFFFPQIQNELLSMSVDELQSKQIEIILNGHAKKVFLMNFIRPLCHKKSHSHNFTCDFRHYERKKQQIPALLQFFDFSICSQGIEIKFGQNQEQETYYNLHCVILFFLGVGSFVYFQDEIVIRWVRKLLKNKRRNY